MAMRRPLASNPGAPLGGIWEGPPEGDTVQDSAAVGGGTGEGPLGVPGGPVANTERGRDRAKLPTSTVPNVQRRGGGVPSAPPQGGMATPTTSKEPVPIAAQSPSPEIYGGGGGNLGGLNMGGGNLSGNAEGLLGGGMGITSGGSPQTDILETLLALLGNMPGR